MPHDLSDKTNAYLYNIIARSNPINIPKSEQREADLPFDNSPENDSELEKNMLTKPTEVCYYHINIDAANCFKTSPIPIPTPNKKLPIDEPLQYIGSPESDPDERESFEKIRDNFLDFRSKKDRRNPVQEQNTYFSPSIKKR